MLDGGAAKVGAGAGGGGTGGRRVDLSVVEAEGGLGGEGACGLAGEGEGLAIGGGDGGQEVLVLGGAQGGGGGDRGVRD